ncbi:MAG TPA: zf-HC2 domain-containing protein, partial [Longimicrobiales bacterium]
MIHLSEGELQAFLDGQLAADERARVADHLADCAACQAELRQLKAAAVLFTRALAHTDLAPDLAGARSLTLRRGRPAPVIRLLGAQSPRARVVRRTFLRAAVLVLLVAGAASAAIPGSAVRRLLVNIWHQTTRLFGARPAAPPPARVRFTPAPAPAPVPPAGVSVLPDEGQVRILVHDAAPGLRVHVRVLDTDRASVEAQGAASTARFRTGPGRIEVNGARSGDLQLGIPRSAGRV